MRSMRAELGMYKQQVGLFKSDIEAASEAMRTLRQRWIVGQRRSRRRRWNSRQLRQLERRAHPVSARYGRSHCFQQVAVVVEGRGRNSSVADGDDLRDDQP